MSPKCLLALAASSLVLFSLSTSAQVRMNLDGKGITRYIGLPGAEKNLMQQHVTISLKVDVAGFMEIVGVARTGTAFNSNWNTISAMDGNGINYEPNLALRNLYAQKKFGENTTLQLGALSPSNGLFGVTGVSGTGWIDGARVNHKHSFADITITGGALGTADNPNAFGRDREFNYLEVRVKKNIFNKVIAEIGYERHEGINFFKTAAKSDISFATDRLLSLAGEALIQDDGNLKATVGVKADLLNLIRGGNSGLVVSANYVYLSDEFSERGTTFSGAYHKATGHNAFIMASYPISKKLGMGAYGAVRLNSDALKNLYTVGFTVKIKGKNQ